MIFDRAQINATSCLLTATFRNIFQKTHFHERKEKGKRKDSLQRDYGIDDDPIINHSASISRNTISNHDHFQPFYFPIFHLRDSSFPPLVLARFLSLSPSPSAPSLDRNHGATACRWIDNDRSGDEKTTTSANWAGKCGASGAPRGCAREEKAKTTKKVRGETRARTTVT